MIKDDYLKILQEYIDEPLYITTSTDELDKELDRNYWWINGSADQIKSLSMEEWTDYIHALISNRHNQLVTSKIKIDLIFYSWYDDQAGQLRFNLINSNHQKLPFGAKYETVSLNYILEQFLSDPCYGVIPFSELIEVDPTTIESREVNDDVNHVVKVFVHKIEHL